ncbi:Aminoglycoside N3'-acetyltransferase [Roseobacter sp. SK209-2-6]|uniref:AAC(3) family N-acetyltransferase n=1 Tax=Roseobacter sp. SK209-2-6 TaxID=388739 RepID=UPI0000F3F4B8|nr:AAC(3) family N-acetyltransferase [Roseobacter sp. SK209-2-6]EBA14545.1 Aminoglycoside N3'-acetyltransferase [Roseobacter sp. SK209-2-6]
MRSQYNRSDLDRALAELPIAEGDVLFLHSNIGFFGRMEGAGSMDDICAAFVEALFERLGPGGTLVVPVFTYSFSRGEVFDPEGSASAMGAFSEWIRRHPDAKRSLDPSYSVAALGARAQELTQNAPENSFGPGSFFARFDQLEGAICNLNFDAGSTYLHYLERQRQVPYRFDKSFEGTIREAGIERAAQSTIYVRYLSDDLTAAAFEPFHRVALERGDFQTQALGRGQIGVIRTTACRQLLDAVLPERPWLLTRADGAGIAPVLTPE